MQSLILNVVDVNMKMHLPALLAERSEGAALDIFFNILLSSFGQEAPGDVMGGVHPACLIYPSKPFRVQCT